MKKNKVVFYQDIGLTDYHTAFEWQTHLFEKLKQIKINNKHKEQQIIDNYFLFTEHHHVYTLGKSGKEEHLLINEKERKKKSVQFVKTNRGGDITYHGPGQIIGYPIIDLDNFDLEILSYIRLIEEVIIRVLSLYGIEGKRSKGETGVWLNIGKNTPRKICAIGVKTSRWVTMHGFALNVHPDLDYFNHIIPCGIKNKGVTSMEKELGFIPNIKTLQEQIINEFTILLKAQFIQKKII